MTRAEAMAKVQPILAHAWMVRAFLKHADEVQDDADMLEVHRMIFDYIRAVEPSFLRGDAEEFVHRAKGKLPKLKKQAEFFQANFQRISDHTNYQMAAASLTAVVAELETVLGAVNKDAAIE